MNAPATDILDAVSTVQQRLQGLFGDELAGYLTVNYVVGDRLKTEWFDNILDAAARIVELSQDRCVWIGMGLRREILPNGERGGSKDVNCIGCLWAEIDYAHPVHKKTDYLPPDREAVMELVSELPVPPTSIIHSGHGNYIEYWFKEPWVFEDADDRDQAQKLLNRLKATVRRIAGDHGYKIDAVGDLARILRSPATVNRKEPHHAVPVIYEQINPDLRYDPSELAEVLDELPEPMVKAVTTVDAGEIPEDDQKVIAMVIKKEKYRRLWEGDITGYESASEADLALMGIIGFYVGWNAERMIAVFSLSKLAERDKWNRDDYRQRTVTRARDGKTDCYQWNRTAAETPAGESPLTDAGNGERLFERHGGKLVRVALWNKWAHYTGTHLQIDNTGEADRLALETLRHMKSRGAQLAKSEDEDQHALGLKLIKWAHKCESDGRIGAMLNRASKVKGATILPEQLDTNPWLLNCPNGTLDLQTFELRPHRREDFITKLCPVKYDPSLTCPQFLAFLDKIFQCNERLIGFVRRMIGYTLTGVTSERAIFILYGCGANGKSTLLAVLRELLGPYAMQTGADTLMAKKQEGIRNDIARLKGARLVSAIESDEGRFLAEGLVKNLSGGSDAITARFLYSEEFEFIPEFKIYLATNHRPLIRGTDSAIWDRIKLIPFDVRFYDTAEEAEDACGDPTRVKDMALLDKLRGELGGILAWAVEGCREWKRDGLGAPEEVQQATQQYRDDMDRLADFITDCCIVGPSLKAGATDLYQTYKVWATLNSEDAMSQTKFGRQLEQKGYRVDRDGSGRKLRLGLGIKVSEQS